MKHERNPESNQDEYCFNLRTDLTKLTDYNTSSNECKYTSEGKTLYCVACRLFSDNVGTPIEAS